MSSEAKAETVGTTVTTAGFAAVPPAPTIEVPAIQREGYNAILAGRTMRTPEAPEGFTVCQYPLGSVERENFLAGCARAVFKGSNVEVTGARLRASGGQQGSTALPPSSGD